MESGINNKLKVAWICHFSNKEVRMRIPQKKMDLLSRFKPLFGKGKSYNNFDLAPWVTNSIKEFEKFDDIELHIIAPFPRLKYLTYDFEMNGVFYHFFKPDILFFSIISKVCWWFKRIVFINRYFVKKIIAGIKPDIVNLIGTENPYYSITVLDIKNIPIYVSAQTVYTNPNRKKLSDSWIQLHWDVELMIHKKETYYGCTGRMHRDLIMQNNPNAIIFKMFFSIEKPNQIKDRSKIYDFVFFAGTVVKKKGIEDTIEALELVKKVKKNVRLNIVGSCSENYKDYLLNKINSLGLAENIVFDSYFPVQSDMHQHIVQSHFAVLPVKLDIIPGTIIEAMFLNLPVVTYKTTGTPYLNKDVETVLISNIGDIDMLAKNMLKLMNSPSLSKKLSENAKTFVEREFDNATSAKRLVNNYRAVIEHFYNNTPIPENQLFNIKEFLLY